MRIWNVGGIHVFLVVAGGSPYPGIEIDEEFVKRLKGGYRMEKPNYASEGL